VATLKSSTSMKKMPLSPFTLRYATCLCETRDKVQTSS